MSTFATGQVSEFYKNTLHEKHGDKFDKNLPTEEKTGDISDEFDNLHKSMDYITNDKKKKDTITELVDYFKSEIETLKLHINEQNDKIKKQDAKISEMCNILSLSTQRSNSQRSNSQLASINHETGSKLTKKQVIKYFIQNKHISELPNLGFNDESEKHIGYWISSGGEASGRAVWETIKGAYCYYDKNNKRNRLKDKSSGNVKYF